MPAVECPSCGNQDLTMLRVVGRDVAKNQFRFACDVCSKVFTHQMKEPVDVVPKLR